MKILPATFIKCHDLSLHVKSLNILYPAFNLSLCPWKQVHVWRNKIQSFESGTPAWIPNPTISLLLTSALVPLQPLFHSAGRRIFWGRKKDHVIPLLERLQWLPISLGANAPSLVTPSSGPLLCHSFYFSGFPSLGGQGSLTQLQYLFIQVVSANQLPPATPPHLHNTPYAPFPEVVSPYHLWLTQYMLLICLLVIICLPLERKFHEDEHLCRF